MHGILAYGSENYEGICLFLLIEAAVLLLSLFAIYYAFQEERKKAITLISPAVIWVIFTIIFFGYSTVMQIIRGNTLIEDNGVPEYLLIMFISMILPVAPPLIMIIIVGLILWFRGRQ